MKKTLLFAAAVIATAACCPRTQKAAGIDYGIMDTLVRPGDDFAKYAAGHWIDKNPKPAEYPIWGTAIKVHDDNIHALSALFEEIAAGQNRKGSVEQKIGDLYNMMMDSTRLNADGAKPIMKYLEEIRGLQTREELIAMCTREHDNLFFDMGIYADEKDSKNNIVCIGQGGLSLPNKDYYTSEDPQSVVTVEATKKYIKTLFTLVGCSEEEAAAKMNRIWEIETELAASHYSNEQLRDVEANYHKMSVAGMSALCGGFDWDGYLKANRYDRTTEVDLGQPEPVAKGCELLMTLPLEDLKTVYEYAWINSSASILSDDFTDAQFEMNQAVVGVAQKTPRWKMAQGLVSNLMSDAVGQMYVKKHFSRQAKKEMLEMIANLQESLGERIEAQEWMCDSTKAKALDKLAAFTVKVGYPDKWDDLSGLDIDPALSLYENVREAGKFYWELNYSKKYGKPVDPDEWHMPAHMVNAYYNPTTNEICFPAGFLQPPLFDVNADAASNYGSVGVVIGHEMTHGFDDQGRLFTKEGNMENWWTTEDAEGFKKPCEAMVNYFNTLWVIPDQLHANGTLTLGENIADHGGLNIAYNAFRKWQEKHGRLADDNGFTPEQRFFLSYGRTWAGVASPELLSYLTMIDVHSVDFLRVNGALSLCDYWYDAFDIQPGDKYYVAPQDRVNIW